jgi:uncharacterized protein YdeI (YjbR/CyaY-like superfamily)
MGKKDARVDAYITRSPDFARPILTYLRDVVHEGCPDLVETMKWSTPTFDHRGILCSMAAFRQHCVFGFWKAPLLTLDGKPLVEEMASGAGQFGKLTSVKDLPAKSKLLKLVKDAARLNESGVAIKRAPRAAARPVQVPDDLTRALHKNAKARAVFAAFSPSHKREYVEWIVEAKTPETRLRRLETALGWMGDGKPRNWKYMRK